MIKNLRVISIYESPRHTLLVLFVSILFIYFFYSFIDKTEGLLIILPSSNNFSTDPMIGTNETASMTGKPGGKVAQQTTSMGSYILMNYHSAMSSLHFMVPLKVSTYSQDQSENRSVEMYQVGQLLIILGQSQTIMKLPEPVIADLSIDQHYGYKRCSAIIEGVVVNDQQCLKVGPFVHSQLLTFGSWIFRYYIQ